LRLVGAQAHGNAGKGEPRCEWFHFSGVVDIKTASYQPCPSLNRVASVILVAVAFVTLVLSGCALMKHSAKPKEQTQAQSQAEQSGSEGGDEAQEPSPEPTPPALTVHISYAHRNDYLESLSVAKFASASQISTHGLKSGSEVMRFEGGEPVGEKAADRGLSGSLLGHVPGVAENKKFAITGVTYGTQPRNFSKDVPENSDPEPLEPGKYYIFTVRRATGTESYQAVHITMDGTVQSYDAQPRAGTSYELCCDVAPDFGSAVGSDSNGEAGGAGSGDTGGGTGAGTSGFPEP
jgi:hypothetical protein